MTSLIGLVENIAMARPTELNARKGNVFNKAPDTAILDERTCLTNAFERKLN